MGPTRPQPGGTTCPRSSVVGSRSPSTTTGSCSDAVDRARSKLEWSPLAPLFCRPEFTIGELRHVYETIWGLELDPASFDQKVTNAEGFLVETGEHTDRDGGRPAKLYRQGSAERIHPPLNLRGNS